MRVRIISNWFPPSRPPLIDVNQILCLHENGSLVEHFIHSGTVTWPEYIGYWGSNKGLGPVVAWTIFPSHDLYRQMEEKFSLT